MSEINTLITILTSVGSAIGAAGIVWGTTISRIRSLEKYVERHSDIKEQLVRMETKLEMLIHSKELV